MSADRILTPPPHALACANCTAWREWDSIAVGRETAAGFVVVGRKPTGQCRAAPPSINPDAIGSETAAWPVVGAEDWCRQFDLRNQQEEAA
jgi:hypothetical protein